MKKKLLVLALTLALLLPLIPAASVYAEGEKPAFCGTSLTLENNIAINFVVDAYAFKQAGFTLPQVTFVFQGVSTTVTRYTMKNGYYYFTFHNLYSMYMGESVRATLSAVRNGERVYGDPVEQSVISYCSELLSLYGDNTTLRTLVVDLLTYGAKSQLYFDYITGELATRELTPEQLEWGTASNPNPTSIKNVAFASVTDPEVIWYGSNLVLKDSVDLQFFFTAADPSLLRIDVKNGSGDTLATFYEEDMEDVGGYLRVRLNTLTPDQMSEALYVTAYRNLGDFGVGEGELPIAGLTESPVSDTLLYSIESYAAEAIEQKRIPALTALLKAMLNYGASTAAYAAAPGSGTVVTTPTLRSTLEALPVASASMTNTQLRNLVINFFEMSSSIPWVTRTNIPYTYNGNEDMEGEEDANYTILANTIYCGMPYSNAGSSIYQFLDYYNEETGVLTQPYGGKLGKYLGNHCCSAVYWAWSRISSTISFQSTDYMTFANGVLPVGDYEIDQTVAHFTADYNTKTVCTNNGSSVMYEAYAQLKPGDALVAFNKEGDTLITHHAMLAKSVTKRTGLFSGAIQGSSYVVVDDQSNSTQGADIGGQSATRFGRLDREITFETLYNNGYIPITCAELAGTSAVQKAAAGLNSNPAGAFTLAKLGAKSVQTNYPMAKVTLSALDGRGNTVACVFSHMPQKTKSCSLSTLAAQLDDQLAAGTYTIRVEVILSNGQTKTAYVHTLTKA